MIQTGKARGAGLIVCKDCLDVPWPTQFRPEIIQAALENSPEEMQVADILRTPPNPNEEGFP